MGTDNDATTELMFCVDGKVLGPVSDHLVTIEAPTVHAHEAANGVIIDFPEEKITIKGVFSFWGHRCRSRRRFIKLMGGCFGIPRNVANHFAEATVIHGTFQSYQQLWNIICFYVHGDLLNHRFSIKRPVTFVPDAPDGASE